MQAIIESPLFSVVLCLIAFEVGIWINKKTKIAALNPLLIAIALVIVMLKLLQIPLEIFDKGGRIISLFLAPATVVLAIPMYTYFQILKENWMPIVVGTCVGAISSIISVIGLCKIFGLDEKMVASMIPKSVTTPIAMEVSKQGGGIVSLTVAAVIVTGIIGAVIAPALIKLFGLKDSVSKGLAIGACSHAVGTSKAIELGEVEGAMSGLAIGLTGIFTVIFSLLLK